MISSLLGRQPTGDINQKPYSRVSLLSAMLAIHRVKWRHISMVAIRSPFCRSSPSYCA